MIDNGNVNRSIQAARNATQPMGKSSTEHWSNNQIDLDYGQGGFCRNTYNTIVQAAIHASAITVRERMAVIATPLPRLRDERAGSGRELGSPIAALLSPPAWFWLAKRVNAASL